MAISKGQNKKSSHRWKESVLLLILFTGAAIALFILGPFQRADEPQSPSSSRETRRISLLIAPIYGENTSTEDLQPITEHLEKALPVTIHTKVAKSYEETLQSVIESDVDIAILPALACVKARESNENTTLLAIGSYEGRFSLTSLLITRKNSPLPSISSLGLPPLQKICYADRLSTSALLAQSWLSSHGLEPTELEGVELRGHLEAIRGLLEARCHAVATHAPALSAATLSGIDISDLQVHTTGSIPQPCWLGAPALEERISRGLSEALWLFEWDASRDNEGNLLKIRSFRRGNDSSYRAIRIASRLAS